MPATPIIPEPSSKVQTINNQKELSQADTIKFQQSLIMADQGSSESAADDATLTHEKFNASESDITFRSSDNVLFHLHRKNLETNTGAFPGAEFETLGQEVVLTEPAEVLEILFQFIYPSRHPNLKNMDFEFLAEIAEAVEKYEVFPAMNMCEVRLREHLPAHAAEIFAHAIKHDYTDLIDETSSLFARAPLTSILSKLPDHLVREWVQYNQAWNSVFDDMIENIKSAESHTTCGIDISIGRRWICRNCRFCLIAWVTMLEKIREIPALKQAVQSPFLDRSQERVCNGCVGNTCLHLPRIQQICLDRINAMPLFSAFIMAEANTLGLPVPVTQPGQN